MNATISNCLHSKLLHFSIYLSASLLCHYCALIRAKSVLFSLILQLSMHDPMVSLSWKKLSSMPVGMQNAQARVLGNKIYVGGGTTGMIDMSSKVYVYDYIYDKWEILPKSPVYNFALEVYDSSILLIGGRDTDSGEVTGEVFFWNQAENIWKEDLLPSMPTARHSASSTTYGQYIVVAGGFALTTPVSNVEVYSGTKLQWLSAQHLPQAQSHMKQVVANGSLILMGGSGAKGGTLLVFSTSLETLISNAEERLLHHGSLAKSVVWKTLPQLPYMHSSAAYFGNSVVAMGREGSVSRSPVYAYSPDTLTWILVSELPFKIENATVIAIPSGDVMILGGLAGEHSEPSKQVYISSLLSSKGKASPKLTRAAIQGESQELLFKERKDLQPPADVFETLPATSVSGATLLRTVWANTHHTSDRLSSQSSIYNE